MPRKDPHPGITMHELPVGSNFPGLLFAVGSALIFLLAIPALWYVVGAAVVVGITFALVRYFLPAKSKSPNPLGI